MGHVRRDRGGACQEEGVGHVWREGGVGHVRRDRGGACLEGGRGGMSGGWVGQVSR